MKNLLHSLGRRQRADKKEECLPRGSAGEKEEQVFFPFSSCDVKMVGEEIIRRARREGGEERRGEKKKQQKENKLERRDQCIYTIHL